MAAVKVPGIKRREFASTNPHNVFAEPHKNSPSKTFINADIMIKAELANFPNINRHN
jgi:hypothetical protein